MVVKYNFLYLHFSLTFGPPSLTSICLWKYLDPSGVFLADHFAFAAAISLHHHSWVAQLLSSNSFAFFSFFFFNLKLQSFQQTHAHKVNAMLCLHSHKHTGKLRTETHTDSMACCEC